MTQLPHSAILDTLDTAVAEFARATSFSLAFGGVEADEAITVTALAGTRTDSLAGLYVRHSRGLGGRAMSEARPRLTPDYARSRLITHDYDVEIGAESIVTLLAVPVVLDGRVRAVLYGGNRADSPVGPTFVQAGVSIARELAREFRVHDEVQRRVACERAQLKAAFSHAMAARTPSTDVPSDILEELRGEHAQLRQIAAELTDPALKERLTGVGERLARLGAAEPDTEPVHLSPRELDVLTHAALGNTNAEIGQALALAESTVKSYLKTAMTKLGASTRVAAVGAARRAGLIP